MGFLTPAFGLEPPLTFAMSLPLEFGDWVLLPPELGVFDGSGDSPRPLRKLGLTGALPPTGRLSVTSLVGDCGLDCDRGCGTGITVVSGTPRCWGEELLECLDSTSESCSGGV